MKSAQRTFTFQLVKQYGIILLHLSLSVRLPFTINLLHLMLHFVCSESFNRTWLWCWTLLRTSGCVGLRSAVASQSGNLSGLQKDLDLHRQWNCLMAHIAGTKDLTHLEWMSVVWWRSKKVQWVCNYQTTKCSKLPFQCFENSPDSPHLILCGFSAWPQKLCNPFMNLPLRIKWTLQI